MGDTPKSPKVCRRCGKDVRLPDGSAALRCPHCGLLLPVDRPKEDGK